jgi:glutathione S-transferase
MNCGREPDGYRWDAAAQRDIDRIQSLWGQLIQRSGGPFLGGSFGVVDAMFAPVAIRFRGFGVPLDTASQNYVDALYALPALQQWLNDAAQEGERLQKYETLRG